MAAKLPTVGGSPSTPPPVTSVNSQWNSRPIEILLGLGAIGIAVVVIKLIAEALPSPNPAPKTQEDPPELIKFLSEQHKSGLLSKRKTVCVNEDKPLSFEQFAEGIIRFKTVGLNLKEGDEFFTRCAEYRSFQRVEPFFTQTTSPEGDIEFFVPNLPLKHRIKVEFGTSLEEVSLDLTVDQARGIYTIFKEKLSYYSSSEAAPSPIIRTPFIVNNSGHILVPNKPQSLENPISIRLSENSLPSITTASAVEKGHLIISNSGERCVAYLQLTSGKHSIPFEHRDIVVPLVISAGKTKAISKKMLDDLWKNGYRCALSRNPPESDLDLRLSGIQQMIYRNPDPPKT